MGRTEQQHFFSSHADKQEGWELSWSCQLCQHSGKLSILPWLCLYHVPAGYVHLPGLICSGSAARLPEDLRSCTKAQACCQHGHLKPAYPQRRWASMSLTQEVPPGMSPRRWTQGSSTHTTLLAPIPMSQQLCCTSPQHLQKQTSLSPPVLQKEAGQFPQALLGGAAGTGVPCGRDQGEMLPFQGTRQARDRSYCR